MVLVGDIVGDDADAVARATSEVVRIANSRSGEGFVAVSPEARKKFWLDRKRTAAISKHTNAFKINEDVVIPLPRMAEYTDGIERINIELSLRNKLKLADALEAFFAAATCRWASSDDAGEIPSRRVAGGPRARRRWPWCARCARCGAVAGRARRAHRASAVPAAAGPCAARQLEDADPRAAAAHLRRRSRSRRSWPSARRIHKRVLKGRVWVALHMHAGDGNVHTNIPVNSDDYEMLQTAHEAVERIMALARSLDGVISGEHGIGITKLEFLTDEELRPFADYKQRSTPKAASTRASCCAMRRPIRPTSVYADLTNAYTPSFGLMGHESLIMQQSATSAPSPTASRTACAAASASRCARPMCRAPTCCTARATRSWPPRCWSRPSCTRSRRAAASSIKHWEEFEDVADHCTVCHKCESPCPVKIDFGDVSMNMRNLLRKMGQKSFRPGNAAAMLMLNATNPQTIKLLRSGMVDVGFKAQRLANDLLRGLARKQTAAPPATHRRGAGQGAGDPLHQQEAARRPAEEDGARAAGHRGQGLRPDHPRPEGHHGRDRGGVLFPGLRLGAAVLPGGPGDAGDAVARRRADGAAAGLPVLRLPAARLRASSTRPRRSSPTTACCSTASPTR